MLFFLHILNEIKHNYNDEIGIFCLNLTIFKKRIFFTLQESENNCKYPKLNIFYLPCSISDKLTTVGSKK